jgi:hypothetical protein
MLKKHITMLSLIGLCRPCINMQDEELLKLEANFPELFVPKHTCATPDTVMLPLGGLAIASNNIIYDEWEEDTGLKNGARQPPNTKVKCFTKEDRRAITKQKKLAKKQRAKR